MPHRQFVREQLYRDTKKSLERALQNLPKNRHQGPGVEAALRAYEEFMELTDDTFPMLLSVGPPFEQLPWAPSALYLLPPVEGMDDCRVLVCQFPWTPEDPAALVLYKWHLAGSSEETPVNLLCGASSDNNEYRLRPVPEGCDLRTRPRRILPVSLTKAALVFHLEFDTGSLTVTAIPDGPPAFIGWQRRKDPSSQKQTERISSGDMPEGLHFRHRTDSQFWPDDEVLAPDGKTIRLNNPHIGRINGMDGLLDSTQRYLASNDGRVLCIDMATGEVRHSPDLGGQVEDILVIPNPYSQETKAPLILAPCYDGIVYWLKDGEQGLSLFSWQNIERLHIRRLMGTPRGEVLAMDQYHRLWSLRINDVADYIELRNSATRRLAETLAKVTDADLAGQNALARVRQRLLINLWLISLPQPEPAQTARLDKLVDNLFSQMNADPPDPGRCQAAAEFHHRLLKRLWQVWRNRHLRVLKSDRDGIPPELRSAVLALMVKMLNLPDRAPDWLWLKIFRDWDLLEPWGRSQQGWEHFPEFETALAKLAQILYRQRLWFASYCYELRPLLPFVSSRLNGQARHVRALSSSPENHRFVCTAYSQGLFAFDLIWESGVPRFRQIAQAGGNRHQLGLTSHSKIRTVAANISGEHDEPLLDLVFIATQRGECRLLVIRHGGFSPMARLDVPMDCVTARFAVFESESGRRRRGFFIAGSSPDEKAAIGWLGLDAQNNFHPYRELYRSEEKGLIRMLARPDDKQNRDLWAIDQHQGLLLYWKLDPLFVNPRSRLTEPKVWYRAASQLHALYATKDGSPPQILCAGHDGMVVALDRRTTTQGRLLWSAGCGTAMRRIRRVCAEKNKGLFILGGDSEHLLILDDQGQFTGMMEDVGPISALGTLGKGLVLVGAKSGRLMGLSLHRLADLSPDSAQTLRPALPQDPCSYALRQPPSSPGRSLGLESILQLLRSREPLLMLVGLAQWWRWMDSPSGDPPDGDKIRQVEQAIRTRATITNQTKKPDSKVHRSALAILHPRGLYDGGDNWQPSPNALLLDWIEAHWQALSQRDLTDSLCQVADAALKVLEEPRALNGDAAIGERVASWSQCLWENQPLPDGPKTLYLPSRLREMRLAQAMRAWRVVTQETSKRPSVSVIDWVNRLFRLWGNPLPELGWKRIKWLMDSRFPFAGEVLEDPWMAYLRNPEKSDNIAKLGLSPLTNWSADQGWRPAELKGLDSVFDIKEWKTWIDKLIHLVGAVDQARLTVPHFAWREDTALKALSDHLTATAAEQLTPTHGLALAALFWSQWKGPWIDSIGRRQQVLHDVSLSDDTGHYLDITPQFHWNDRHSVRVCLALRFRGTRPLIVERAFLHPENRLITSSPVQAPIPADADFHDYSFTLEATADDKLDCGVELRCQDFRGIQFRPQVDLQDERGLQGFRREPGWGDRAKRLIGLLEQRTPLLWLRGPDWPQAEHERLEALVRDRYSAGWQAVRQIKGLEEIGPATEELFVPGFSPEPGEEVAATHALLHQGNPGRLDPWALAFWLDARGEEGLRLVLAELLPSKETTTAVGCRLLGNEAWESLRNQLRNLPANRMVAWACGGDLDDEAAPRLGDLGLTAWKLLLASNIEAQTLARLLGVTSERFEAMEDLVRNTEALSTGSLSGKRVLAEFIARPLFSALLPQSQVGSYKGIPFAVGDVDVLHHRLARIYLLPRGLEATAPFDSQDEDGLWLSIGGPRPPSLPGEVLSLDSDQTLALLGAGDPRATQRRLNEIAGGQLALQPERVFQVGGGIRWDLMERAFHGRQRERRALMSLCQGEGGGAALLVGGRRTGKTSLLDRLRYDLEQSPKPYLWTKTTFLNVPTPKREGEEDILLRWFLNRLKEQFERQGEMIRYDWSQLGNEQQRVNAISIFTRRLGEMKKRGSPIMLLDETAGLLWADPKNHVGNLLREWKEAHLVTIIATAFPYGSSAHPSLYKRIQEQGENNPWYNFFSEGHAVNNCWLLEPWSPRETWDFFVPRLAGFGIALPRTFERGILGLCRGEPWITQTLGLSLCEIHSSSRRRITRGDWSAVVGQVRRSVRDYFSKMVHDIASILDQEAANAERGTRKETFGNNRLWTALVQQASRVGLASVSSKAEDWPAPHYLDLIRFGDDLRGIAPERQEKALVSLSEVGLLIGEENNTRFSYWNDLLPAVLTEHDGIQEEI